MELRQLRYFAAVARERNFTRAARTLGIAQPPLSRQVRQLEDELGAQLLERNSRPVQLTAVGRLVYEQAVAVLERVDEITALATRAEAKAGLRIGFVGYMLYGRLPEVIRAYRKARPAAELALVELTTMEQVAALKDRRIDLGFGRVPFDDPALDRRLIEQERLWLAAPVDHPAVRQAGPLRLADLEGETLIVYPRAPRPSYADQVLALLRDRGVRPRAVREVRELQTALGLVAAEDGVCLVPAAVRQLRRDDVRYREIIEADAVSPVFMITRNGDPSTEVALVTRLIGRIYGAEAAPGSTATRASPAGPGTPARPG